MSFKTFEKSLEDAQNVVAGRDEVEQHEGQTPVAQQMEQLFKRTYNLSINLDLVLALKTVDASPKVWQNLCKIQKWNGNEVTLKALLIDAYTAFLAKKTPPYSEECIYEFAMTKMVHVLKAYRPLWDVEDD